jgi:hypothetical protein
MAASFVKPMLPGASQRPDALSAIGNDLFHALRQCPKEGGRFNMKPE